MSTTQRLGNWQRVSTAFRLLFLILAAVPKSFSQYYYQQGYNPQQQQQFYQFSDQGWQYQQHNQQFQQPPLIFQPQPIIFDQPPPPQPPQQFMPVFPQAPPQPPPVRAEETRPVESPSLPPKSLPRETRLEFDLPPPPPSRFLPDENEKVKIAQLLAQQRSRRPRPAPARSLVQQQLQAQRKAILQQQKLEQEQRKQLQQQAQARSVEPTPSTTTPQPTTTEQTRPPPIAQIQVQDQEEPAQRAISHLSDRKSEPNKVFLSCCKHKKVDKKCESRCNFDTINKKVLTQMFLGTDPCPQSFGLDLFACAAQDSDHTPCCIGKKVERTAAGEKCLAFCKMTPESHFQADASYLPCWSVLNHVKACFKEAILKTD